MVKINWSDNPWFPETLRREKDELKARDPDGYQNIWEGHCRVALEGAIYAKELRLAQEEGRIGAFPMTLRNRSIRSLTWGGPITPAYGLRRLSVPNSD